MTAARRPLIAHVTSERGFSGGEVQVFLLMAGLRELGWPQVLVAPADSESARVARARGFEVRPARLGRALDVVGFLAVRRALRGVALAQLHTGRAAWLGSLAARSLGLPAVITRRMDRRVRKGLRTHLAYNRCAQRTVAISPAVRQCLLDGGVADDRIEVIYEAVDPARIVANRPRAAVRAELGVGDRQLLLLLAARLTRRKGGDVLLAALARLDDPDLVLAIAGDGPERGHLRSLADRLGIAARTRFLGNRDDVGDLLAGCDLFVLPSRQEGLGNAALEALGAGRPVVCSRVGGLATVVVHEQCGLLVPPEDPEALAAAIGRLCADAPLRAALGSNGPGRLDQGFRPAQMVAAHVGLYERLLGRPADQR